MCRTGNRTHASTYCAAASFALASLVGAVAHAQEPPPVFTPPPGDDSGSDAALGIFANVKIGPAFGIGNLSGYGAFALELEGGYAVMGKEGYVTFSPNFAFGDRVLITLPVGFQYEFELPVENLYVYGRATLGVGFVTGRKGGAVFHFGPHIGAKYKITKMFHAGLEPISLPIYVGDSGGVVYRILAYGGVDF